MKRFVLIFIFSSVLCAFGQADSLDVISVQDTVIPMEEINLDMFELPPVEAPLKEFYNEKEYIRYMCFFTGLDFGGTSLHHGKYPLKWNQSFLVRLNFVEYKKQFIANRFGFFSGISLGYQQFGFKNDFKFVQFDGQTTAQNDSIDYLKNQLRSFSVSVPLMLELNVKNTFENNLHLAFGVQGSYRYANSTYHKHEITGATIVRKNSEDIYVNRINLDACIRLGFQNLTFFASKSLTPLFNSARFQTELYPIVVGLCIIPVNLNPEESSNDFDF
jgi:hypothetical protein